jgi:hypothetical protein
MAGDSFKLVFHFLRHLLYAALLFCAVAAVAILLWYSTKLMGEYGIPDEIRLVCFYVSELLFWLDVGCLVLFVLAEVIKFLRELWDDFRGPGAHA